MPINLIQVGSLARVQHTEHQRSHEGHTRVLKKTLTDTTHREYRSSVTQCARLGCETIFRTLILGGPATPSSPAPVVPCLEMEGPRPVKAQPAMSHRPILGHHIPDTLDCRGLVGELSKREPEPRSRALLVLGKLPSSPPRVGSGPLPSQVGETQPVCFGTPHDQVFGMQSPSTTHSLM